MKNTANFYALAIEALTDKQFGSLTWKSVCVQIAKHHPKMFCDALKRVTQPDPADVAREVLMNGPDALANKSKAIKAYRELTGEGLVVAKDVVEAIMSTLRLN